MAFVSPTRPRLGRGSRATIWRVPCTGRARPRRRLTSFVLLAAAAAIVLAAVLGSVSYQRSRFVSAPHTVTSGTGEVIAITLPAVLVRGEGETPTARIGNDARAIESRLERGDAQADPPFEVTVRTVEGMEVWRGAATALRGGAAAAGRLIATVTVPAVRLAAADYVVVLASGAADGGELQRYYLRVVHR